MKRENWKRQTFWSLPVYTGDVSGVCSALYELGGMVVMHDPSGCNSTYNTHDEIRWMDMESLIFLSGLRDIDAITGNDRKLIDDISESARLFHPKFIAIANSPVPWLIGTDFRSICHSVRQETGIPVFHVETNAMHDYTYGAGRGFLELARMLFEEENVGNGNGDRDGYRGESDRQEKSGRQKEPGRQEENHSAPLRVNVLGMTPLDFTVRQQVQTLKDLLSEHGFETVSVWGIGDTLDTLAKAPSADVNLVVSSTGLYAAQYLKEKFGIPYAAGIPAGAFCDVLLQALSEAAVSGKDRIAYLEVLEACRGRRISASGEYSDAASGAAGTGAKRAYCGEPVTMGSLAADRAIREQCRCDIVCLTETAEGLLADADSRPQGEEEIRKILAEYTDVTADPMLRPACRKDVVFHELPHFAYSGRLYLNRIPALVR